MNNSTPPVATTGYYDRPQHLNQAMKILVKRVRQIATSTHTDDMRLALMEKALIDYDARIKAVR